MCLHLPGVIMHHLKPLQCSSIAATTDLGGGFLLRFTVMTLTVIPKVAFL
jgi:hypothetical protein